MDFNLKDNILFVKEDDEIRSDALAISLRKLRAKSMAAEIDDVHEKLAHFNREIKALKGSRSDEDRKKRTRFKIARFELWRQLHILWVVYYQIKFVWAFHQ